MTLIVGSTIVLLVKGCCSVPKAYRPVAEFQHKHPAEFGQYSYLNPIMLDTYKMVWGERAGSTSVILEEVERRFGKVPRVKEFVKSELQQETEDGRDS
jgi:hypothetical protein